MQPNIWIVQQGTFILKKPTTKNLYFTPYLGGNDPIFDLSSFLNQMGWNSTTVSRRSGFTGSQSLRMAQALSWFGVDDLWPYCWSVGANKKWMHPWNCWFLAKLWERCFKPICKCCCRLIDMMYWGIHLSGVQNTCIVHSSNKNEPFRWTLSIQMFTHENHEI